MVAMQANRSQQGQASLLHYIACVAARLKTKVGGKRPPPGCGLSGDLPSFLDNHALATQLKSLLAD